MALSGSTRPSIEAGRELVFVRVVWTGVTGIKLVGQSDAGQSKIGQKTSNVDRYLYFILFCRTGLLSYRGAGDSHIVAFGFVNAAAANWLLPL